MVNDRNGSAVAAWGGREQLENALTLAVTSLEVKREDGLRCAGNLTVANLSANGASHHFSWQASYSPDRERWIINDNTETGGGGDGCIRDGKAISDLGGFITRTLSNMRTRGEILKPALPAGVKTAAPLPKSAESKPEDSSAAAPLAAVAAPRPGASEAPAPLAVIRIPVERIRANSQQPRKYFRKFSLALLADSIKQEGQLEPIEVIPVEGDPDYDYELIIGERRWRAAQMGKISHLDAIVRSKQEVPDKVSQDRRCFTADFHREGYGDLEISLALMEQSRNGLNLKQLSLVCGRSITWVSQHLAVNNLIPALRDLLSPSLPKERRLSYTIARFLARLPQDRQMPAYEKVKEVIGPRLRVMEAKRLVAEINPEKSAGRARKPSDSVSNLRCIVPRILADAQTADRYPGEVFASLADNHGSPLMATMVDQISLAINELVQLKKKIVAAQSNAKN